MTFVITQNCCNDAACVPVCPVNCIHPTPDEPGYSTTEMLYIDPDTCIDCGACVDVCPVGAITADFELPASALRFEDLNAQYYRDPARRGYSTDVTRTAPRKVVSASTALRVAVVGSGPAASYAAEELLSTRGLDVHVDMFERLATPWGLVRSGVAPDHQATKKTTDAFSRTYRRKNLRLLLNVEVGRDVTHQDLVDRYHAVIYAVGATGDRPLGIPGEDLPGSHSATEFVAWYNGHPDYADRTFDLSGERAVVIGNGNVALDVARVLLSHPDSLDRTDIADHALEQLAGSRIREVVVVGRRGPAQAAFTVPELLGLAEVPGLDILTAPAEVGIDDVTRAALGDQDHAMGLYKAGLIAEIGARPPAGDRRLSLRFLSSPVELVGHGRVEGVRLVRNELVGGDDHRVVAVATDAVEEIGSRLVLRSVGYQGRPIAGLPFDPERGVLPNVGGRVTDGTSHEVVVGVYTAGWVKRGPSGVIGTNKRCAAETVASLLDDFVAGRLHEPRSTDDIATEVPDHVELSGWAAIDARERASGREQSRPRVKLTSWEALLTVARGAAG